MSPLLPLSTPPHLVRQGPAAARSVLRSQENPLSKITCAPASIESPVCKRSRKKDEVKHHNSASCGQINHKRDQRADDDLIKPITMAASYGHFESPHCHLEGRHRRQDEERRYEHDPNHLMARTTVSAVSKTRTLFMRFRFYTGGPRRLFVKGNREEVMVIDQHDPHQEYRKQDGRDHLSPADGQYVAKKDS